MTKTFGFIFLCLKQITLNLISFGLKLIMKIHFKDKKVKMQPKKVFNQKLSRVFFGPRTTTTGLYRFFLSLCVCFYVLISFCKQEQVLRGRTKRHGNIDRYGASWVQELSESLFKPLGRSWASRLPVIMCIYSLRWHASLENGGSFNITQ